MECKVRQHLTAYLDGELPAALRTEVAEHLAGCPACARELEELRLAHSLLERWATPEPSSEARARAWRALRRERRPAAQPARERPGWVRPLVRYALPLAAGVLLVVLVTVHRERRGPTVPDEVIAELPVLENLEMLEALDVLTEWENLQALAALEPTLLPGDAEEVTP